MQVTKKQHYVSKGILNFFTNSKNQLYEFLVNDINKKPYPLSPDGAMCERFTYEHDLLKINTIEDLFANTIDGEIPKVIKRAINKIGQYEKNVIDIEEVYKEISNALELFLLHYYRSGALLEEFSSNDEARKIELMLHKILDSNYIALLASTIKDFYKFAILESDNNFLISDQYISTAALKVKSQFVEVSNRNIGLKETVILIPLSSRYYVVFWNSDKQNIFREFQINFIDEVLLEKINRVILNNSYKKCVGTKKSVCQKIQDKFIHNSPSTVFSESFSFTKKKEVFWSEKDALYWKSFKSHKKPDEFNNLGRNEICSCGSGKKYKRCHHDYSDWWNIIVATFEGPKPFVNVMGKNKEKYIIMGVSIIEAPIDQLIKGGYKQLEQKQENF